MQIFDIGECESRIGYSFKDKLLLRQCFTHASYSYENGGKDNELLEFFGDAIIQYVVTDYLFKNACGDEGDLTNKRARIVSKEPLQKVVHDLNLGDFVLLGKGKAKNKNKDDKLYSSIFEALVAGIYLDGGLASAKKFITNTIIKDFEKTRKKQKTCTIEVSSSAKNAFQEYVQKYKLGSIKYELLWKKGPEHTPEFRVVATLNGTRIAEGSASSKKMAEAVAADLALKILKKQGGKEK
jgi:ribonuclease-3